MGGTVVQWLVLSPYSESSAHWSLSQSKDVHIWLTAAFKVAVGILCLPCERLTTSPGCPSHLAYHSWDGLQSPPPPPPTLNWTSGKENRWMENKHHHFWVTHVTIRLSASLSAWWKSFLLFRPNSPSPNVCFFYIFHTFSDLYIFMIDGFSLQIWVHTKRCEQPWEKQAAGGRRRPKPVLQWSPGTGSSPSSFINYSKG